MIVRLSHPQWSTVRARISPEMIEVMKQHRRRNPNAHDYLLPAIGWKIVLDDVSARAYGPRGGKVDKAPASLYRAIARIAAAVGGIEAHPGLTPGLAVEGFGTDVIPAWWDSVATKWSPYPTSGRFVMLGPVHSRVGELDVTCWVPRPPSDSDDVLADEAFHLSVAVRAQPRS